MNRLLVVFSLATALSVLKCSSQQTSISIIIQGPISQVSQTNQTNKRLWQNAFSLRVRKIEAAYGIKFDPKWKPVVEFGIPDDIPIQLHRQFGAQYIPETQSFIIAPAEVQNLDFPLIDHELGHALADQISRRMGNGTWPNIERYPKLDWDEQIGINFISEGIGSYFQYQGKAPYPKDEEEGYGWLPENELDICWQVRECMYKGGRWIVAEIIKRFGEKGIEYLVTHPLRFKDYNLRFYGQEYRHITLEWLKLHQENKH